VFKSSPESYITDMTQPVVGAVLIRYIFNIDTQLVEKIQKLLEVSVAIYHNRHAVSFKRHGFIYKSSIDSETYNRLQQQTDHYETVEMYYGGIVSEYKLLRDIEGQPVAVLGIHTSVDQYVNIINQAIVTFVGIMLLCIIFASFLGYLLAQSILEPINKLLTGVKRVTSGDLSHEIIMDLKDEFGILAGSFNSMSRQLKELFNTLEQRIEDATKKLQNTLAHMTAIIDNIADGLLVTDVNNKIIRFNPALLEMFPNKKELLGTDCREMFTNEIAALALKTQDITNELYTSEIVLPAHRIGQAVATAIIQKDTLSEDDNQYAGSRYLGAVILIRDITKEKEIDRMLKNTIDTLTRVGTALTSENNLDKLLELCVSEARSLSNADAGTLYILENNQLNFEIVQNKTMRLFKGGTSTDSVDIPPISMDEDRYATECIHNKTIIHTHYIETEEEYDIFRGYQIKEILVLPMLDRMQNPVGVLQLLNPIDPKTGEFIRFTANQIEIIASLASQAAVAIENVRNYEKIERKNIAFQRFVPTEFLQLLGKEEIEEVTLGEASQQYMSVLFSDIRAFTTLSETMTPEDNFHFLDKYLEFIGPSITHNGGFIDKYIGDAIMALFPGSRVGVADDAVTAAVGM
ncbi:MAG: HAMP domain-containing protein, partial [Pseudomonadota bacterium]|nr:HAMP domain-containing protein [Pseudomonadota bacterium]